MSTIEFFSAYPLVLLVFTLIIGLLVGSFLNVVIYRLPVMMEREWADQCSELLEVENTKKPVDNFAQFNLAKPASHCPKCRHKISALENIPLISYLIQGGKCRHCKDPISIRYPLIEFVSGLLSCLIAYYFGYSWLTLAVLFLTWSLIVLTMIDFDHQLLPDDITLPLLWLGLLINSFGLITSLQSAFWGAAGGYMTLWSVFWAFKLITRKDGLGYGDFKLLAVLGAWLGWQVLPLIILLSSVMGAILGLGLLLLVPGRDKNTPFSFGPYLATAGFIALLWGDQLNKLYLSFL